MNYDVVLSFAGENRDIARGINIDLKKAKLTTFFDADHQASLWGKNLAEELMKIFSKDGTYCLMLISRHYIRKMWTKHERRSAISRMIRQRSEYLLPYILDDTKIEDVEGLSPDIYYLRSAKTSPKQVVRLIFDKLKLGSMNEWLAYDLCAHIIIAGIYRRTLSFDKNLGLWDRLNLTTYGYLRDEFYSKTGYDWDYINRTKIVIKTLNYLIDDELVHIAAQDEVGIWYELTPKGKALFESASFEEEDIVSFPDD